MWAQAFVQSFIEVLLLISAFLMQFKIKEMKSKAACEQFYKQDSPGALIRQFCKRLWAAFPRKEQARRLGSGTRGCWWSWKQGQVPAAEDQSRPAIASERGGCPRPPQKAWPYVILGTRFT